MTSNWIGHDANWAQFSAGLTAGRLHHGWILAGPRGLGKAGFAARAAAAWVDADGLHRNLSETHTHPDIIWVQRLPKEPPKEGEQPDPDAELQRSIKVDQIRELLRKLTMRPSMGPKRAIIIDAADDLEGRGSANALLKALEEPPIGTIFILVSHASDRLLPTIRSRCQMLRFDPLNDAQMAEALAVAAPDLRENERAMLIRSGAGSPGQALDFAGLDLGEIEGAMDTIVNYGDAGSKLRHQLAETLSLKAAQPRYEAFLRRVPARIAAFARTQEAANALPAINAFHAAEELAARAIGLTLDKQAVVFQMGSLLASLQAPKQPLN
jgi:DNA polymerase III subunit delta'